MDIEVPVIPINTKYNPVYGLKYLDTVNRNSWPNGAMARYYGVNSIIGMEANVDVD